MLTPNQNDNYPDRKVKFVCGSKEEIRVFPGYYTSNMIDSKFLYWLRKNSLAEWKELYEDIGSEYKEDISNEHNS